MKNKLINLKSTEQRLKISVKKFTDFEKKIKDTISIVNNLPEITDSETRELCHASISDANKLVKSYESIRKEATLPLDDLKKNVMNHQRSVVNPLEVEICNIKAKIMAFDQHAEFIRQEEIAKIEAERKEREEAERKERERIQAHKRRLEHIERENISSINRCETLEHIDDIINMISDHNRGIYEEFAEELDSIVAMLYSAALEKKDQIKKNIEINAKIEKAKRENQKEAEKLAQMKLDQEEKNRKIKEEQDNLEREKRQIEQDRISAEKRSILLKEQESRLKEEEERLKRLHEQKAKGISSGIDEVEIIDLYKVPPELYNVKINRAKLLAYIKKHGEVAGLKVSFKSKLVMNG